MPEKRKRQLAAIMFADMVGYTALMQENEEEARLQRDKHRALISSAVENHHGEIHQYYGDGTLSIFDSAVEAVQSAIEIQRAVTKEGIIPVMRRASGGLGEPTLQGRNLSCHSTTTDSIRQRSKVLHDLLSEMEDLVEG